ncbi:MAG TPA: aldehyde dehydrogenase family protein, partial [Anaerolineales bacterium]|nr:aldehyde dehydrogenase family protein [Anaerolineales bacterium]
ADTVKRVSLELGGKSPNIILDDADLKKAVAAGMIHMANNTGQSCNAPSRMFAPKSLYEEVVAIAAATAASTLDFPARAGPMTTARPLSGEASA